MIQHTTRNGGFYSETRMFLKNHPAGWFSLQVRMAAFTLLMLSDPPEYIWQNIAIRTWFEPRSHVTSFIYTTLETLASFQSPVRFLRKL
jgi:hypothetical protein